MTAFLSAVALFAAVAGACWLAAVWAEILRAAFGPLTPPAPALSMTDRLAEVRRLRYGAGMNTRDLPRLTAAA
jgi:hypothetical protein